MSYDESYIKRMDNSLRRNLMKRYRSKGCSVFEWSCEDEGWQIPSERIERLLFDKGKGCFFKDKGVYKIGAIATSTVDFNWFGEPVKWFALPPFMSQTTDLIECSLKDSVYVHNDLDDTPTMNFIRPWVDKLVLTERLKENNMRITSAGIVFEVPNQGKSFQTNAVANKLMEGVPYITTNTTMKGMNVLNPGIPFLGAEYNEVYLDYDSKILQILGIENLDTKKKERMIVDEATSNDNETVLDITEELKCRQTACERVEELWGLNLTVNLISFNVSDDVTEEDENEGEKDESGSTV
jgi:hypothetical protein